MNPPCETLRLGKQSRDHLIKLKRITGIEHWNIICRWALVVSLREPTPPTQPPEITEGGVEIPWKVLAGELSSSLSALIRMRVHEDGVALQEDLGSALRAHVTRGLGYLASGTETKSIADFLRRWISAA